MSSMIWHPISESPPTKDTSFGPSADNLVLWVEGMGVKGHYSGMWNNGTFSAYNCPVSNEFITHWCEIIPPSIPANRPLSPGTRIRWNDITATVIEDYGNVTLKVHSDESDEDVTWSWEVDDIVCEVIS